MDFQFSSNNENIIGKALDTRCSLIEKSSEIPAHGIEWNVSIIYSIKLCIKMNIKMMVGIIVTCVTDNKNKWTKHISFQSHTPSLPSTPPDSPVTSPTLDSEGMFTFTLVKHRMINFFHIRHAYNSNIKKK